MYKILRIICCVVSALCLAACVFIFVYTNVVWGICSVVAAAAFFALTLMFKGLQKDQEKKQASADEKSKAESQQQNNTENL